MHGTDDFGIRYCFRFSDDKFVEYLLFSYIFITHTRFIKRKDKIYKKHGQLVHETPKTIEETEKPKEKT